MGLDSRMIALGHMGNLAYQKDWRGHWPIVRLVRMFGDEEPCGFEDGSNPIVLDSDALRCITRFLLDPVISLHLWGEIGDAEYYEAIIEPIAEEFNSAQGLAEDGCIDFLFYASY
tara:strand:- start:73 stop:417 length:345 start_codon:yes stop_codon:yes gene_type:complete